MHRLARLLLPLVLATGHAALAQEDEEAAAPNSRNSLSPARACAWTCRTAPTR
ncbi:MAG: hypothetical protein U5K76_14175 [Woeseiaceae bacterium]|nr:hypothetical protein [Woeseiaceae bacterium]